MPEERLDIVRVPCSVFRVSLSCPPSHSDRAVTSELSRAGGGPEKHAYITNQQSLHWLWLEDHNVSDLSPIKI